MDNYRPLKYREQPLFPTNDEAKSFANQHRILWKESGDWEHAFTIEKYSPVLKLVASWGKNGIFFVVAIPPGGFTIAEPEEIEKLQLFEGWILEWQESGQLFNLLYKASTVGLDTWKAKRSYYKSLP